LTDDWDPKPDERTYYRSREDGQRGYLVRRDGKDMIRLDRPMQEILEKLEGNPKWSLDAEVHPLNPHQAAKVAYQADQALAHVLGDYSNKQEWIDLSDKERIRFMKDGPKAKGFRAKFYAGVMELLSELTNGR